jgi:FtsP/CotA-like multicopper oxidase with cupredoxin domain
MGYKLGRRHFLKIAGASAGLAGLSAAGQRVRAQDPTATPHDDMATQGGMDAEAMDAHHQEGVEIFLDRIGQDPAFWGTRLEPEMDGDVKVFNITCQDIQWEVAPGQAYAAMAYNGIVPGPEVRVTEGDQVRMNVTNEMAQSTCNIHITMPPNR